MRLARDFLLVGFVLAAGTSITSHRAVQTPGPPDQETIAKRLLSEDAKERHAAFAVASAIDVADRGQTLRAALIALMERHTAIIARVQQTGGAVETFESGEFIADVQRTVAGMEDPQAIPAMARAMGMFTLLDPLADFGELAASDVLAVVTSEASDHSTVGDGLRVLRFMIEGTPKYPLSPDTIARIKQAAHQRLNGQQYFTTLWHAMDLAAVLNDPELKAILQELATSPASVTARGITDPKLIDQTRRRAADRLAGVPALPHPRR
jgi:hypothetical protein